MTENIKSAIVIGATGLVGRELVRELHQLAECERITVAVRQEDAEYKQMSKVEQLVVSDFFMLNDEDVSGHTHAFSCLGTTIKKAGSKQAFYNTDFGINAHFAELVQDDVLHFLLVSAMGAASESIFFYNRVKGELEDYIQSMDMNRISFIRPSLLLGERQESRILEDLTQNLFRTVEKYIPGNFKYKPVTARQVAHTMVKAAQNQTEKYKVYDNLAIQNMP